MWHSEAGFHVADTDVLRRSATGGEIPVRCTCEGKDLSPASPWTGLPAGTKSLAIIVDDPDAPDPAAPKMTYVHWVLYNIPRRGGSDCRRGSASAALPRHARGCSTTGSAPATAALARRSGATATSTSSMRWIRYFRTWHRPTKPAL